MYSEEWKDRRVDQGWVHNNLCVTSTGYFIHSVKMELNTKLPVSGRYSEYSEKQTIQYNDEGNISTQGNIILITSERTGIMTFGI